jgi:hypothetical protein
VLRYVLGVIVTCFSRHFAESMVSLSSLFQNVAQWEEARNELEKLVDL